MSESWDKQDDESPIWYKRFTQFRLMEPVRTIAATYQQESRNGEEVRSNAPGRWYEIAKEWHWEDRAAAWDAFMDAQLEQQIVAERKHVLRTGYALMHKRIEVLTRLAENLINMTDDEAKVWIADVKAIGNGPLAERVDLVQFNDALFKEIREYLTDIAEETGGRVKKTESVIKSLPKIYLDLDPDEDGSEP